MTRRIPDEAIDAVEKYAEFHRLDPKKIGEFPPSFEIPRRIYRAGTAKWVTYESTKVDPSTLVRPRRPVAYIHEHDAGVTTYLTKAPAGLTGLEQVAVPDKFRDVAALARLGSCLGFCFVDGDGDKHEAEATRPYPDLYTIPDGRCLLVLQQRRERGVARGVEVIAMMWGGALGVFARGIDG